MNRIRTETDGTVGRIILARPEQRNALDRETAEELAAAVASFDRDETVCVLVLRAEGRDFCAGADLYALKAMLDSPLDAHEADARALGDVFLALHNSGKPSVALVQGLALAGGAALASACDMVVAREDAVFGYPEVAIGFVPAIAMALLVRSVGEKRAFDLVATGRRVGAVEALGIGLISRVLPSERFEEESALLINGLACTSAAALKTTKELLHDFRGMSMASAVAEGVHANARARLTDDFRKGVIHFTEARKK
jgi:methylglutaconyl-CoA hydratase